MAVQETFIGGKLVSSSILSSPGIPSTRSNTPPVAKTPSGKLYQIGTVKKRMTVPCVHRGEPTGVKKDCEGCNGGKDIIIYQCTLFGECTVDRKLHVTEDSKPKHYPWCVSCDEYKTLAEPEPSTTHQTLNTPPSSPTDQREIMPLKWAYGVTTVWLDTHGREQSDRMYSLLPQTLESLKKGGFNNPILFVDGCPARKTLEYESKFNLHVEPHSRNIQTHGNWYLSLHELYIRNPKADRYALFQDDMVCYRNLRKYLDWSPYPTKGYLNLYTFPENQAQCPANKASGIKSIGWFPSNQRGLGAVALVFNNEAVKNLLGSYHMISRVQGPAGTRAVDGGIVEAMRTGPLKYPEYCHNPSLVQHTGILSSMMNGAFSPAPAWEGEDFDALDIIPRYNASSVPVPVSNIRLG